MIYYFSGTGNSKWIAEKIAEGTGDQLINVVDVHHGRVEIQPLKPGEKLGFVFPVHAWRAPDMVTELARRMKVPAGTYAYAVATCGEEAGLTLKLLNDIVPLTSTYTFIMPNNYIFGFDVDPTPVIQAKIKKAKERLPEVIDNINQGLKINEVDVGTMAGIKSNFTYHLFNRYGKNVKKFFVQDQCTSCGLCEEVCPTNCIKLEKGKPVWTTGCIACSACINYCPVNAIQFGSATVNKGRYYFKEEW